MNSKISEKDKKTWNEFLSNDQKLPDKDNFKTKIKVNKTRSLDLHGKTLDEATEIKNTDIAEELALPPVKIHCSVLAEDSIKAALADLQGKQESEGTWTPK